MARSHPLRIVPHLQEQHDGGRLRGDVCYIWKKFNGLESRHLESLIKFIVQIKRFVIDVSEM